MLSCFRVTLEKGKEEQPVWSEGKKLRRVGKLVTRTAWQRSRLQLPMWLQPRNEGKQGFDGREALPRCEN